MVAANSTIWLMFWTIPCDITLIDYCICSYSVGLIVLLLNMKIWHANMPHNKIADRKGHQGWMKEDGEYFIFPGGGTMFPEGAIPYIEKLGQYIPIRGGVLRTALDMGCGVGTLFFSFLALECSCTFEILTM